LFELTPSEAPVTARTDPGILQLVVLQSNLADISAREAGRHRNRHDAGAAGLAPARGM